MNIHAGHIQRKPANRKNPFSETLAPQGLYSNPSVDSLDWKEKGVAHETERVLTKTGPGSIILFHNDAKYTPEALPGILEGLIQKGYSFVPVSQLILQENYQIDHAGRQCPMQ